MTIYPSKDESYLDGLWDDSYLPLFDCEIGLFVQTIYHADQLLRKPFRFVQIDRVGGLQILRLETIDGIPTGQRTQR
jgi:hypothetical protein